MWVAVGQGTNAIAYSTNGTQWTGLGTSASTFSGTGYSGNGIAWSVTMWVAVGQGTNAIAYSTNGTQWTGLGTSLITGSGQGIAWSGTMWVAVGQGTNPIAYSYNGTQWTGIPNSASTFTGSGWGIAWSGTMWVAVGQGTNAIAYSTNGTQWTGLGTSTSTFSGTGYTGYGIASNYLPNTWSPILTGSWNTNPYVTGNAITGQGIATATYQIPSGTATNATTGALTYSTYGNALNSYLYYRLIVTNIAAQKYGVASGSVTGQTGGFWFAGFGAINAASTVQNYQVTYTPTVNSNTITGYNRSAVTLKMDSTTLNQLDLSGSFKVSGPITTTGVLSKASGTFDIIHPLTTSKKLVHSFIEGPRCDLIYRGTAQLQNGTTTVNIDTDSVSAPECAMDEGTFEALATNPVCLVQNKTSFNKTMGTITGNILTIQCQDSTSTDIVHWMVIAERKDAFIKAWSKTNPDGFLITEHEI